MKKSILFKLFATLLLTVFAYTGTYAQVTNAQLVARPVYSYSPFLLANYDNTNTETASAGAQMPYYVAYDPAIAAATTFFNPSLFNWTWTGITGVKDITLANTITSGTPASYNFVVATMPAAGTPTTISTQEVSQPKVGSGCTGLTVTTTITVVALPTFSMTYASVGTCGTPLSQNLPLTLTGTAPFYIDYTISAVGMDGVTVVGTTKTYNATLAALTDPLIIDPTQLEDVSGTLPAAPLSGKYTVTVTNVWDTYSFKAMNAASLVVSPATNHTYDILVYPTPVTQPIQHIKQL